MLTSKDMTQKRVKKRGQNLNKQTELIEHELRRNRFRKCVAV